MGRLFPGSQCCDWCRESLLVGTGLPSCSHMGTANFSQACEYCQGVPRQDVPAQGTGGTLVTE